MRHEIINERSVVKRILIYLNTNPPIRNYGSAISKEINSPSSNISLALKYLESQGMVYFKRGEKVKGNWIKNVFLTEKGKQVVKLLIKLENFKMSPLKDYKKDL